MWSKGCDRKISNPKIQKMRKTIVMAVAALLSCATLSAQERMSDEERARAINERIEAAGTRMAKDFKLKDAAKDSFIEIFTAYQKEMFATNRPQGTTGREQAEEKKELSNEDATAKIQENFARQEQQIATMQQRLDVQKKYAEEFAKVLTPQQVLQVLTPRNNQSGRGQGQRNQGNGERRGGFGEGGSRGGFGGGPRGGFGGPGGGF